MASRHQIIVSGCAGALALTLASFIWSAWHRSPQPLAAPVHGSFTDSFQPKLDGIGSTRDLPPVRLEGAEPSQESRVSPASRKR